MTNYLLAAALALLAVPAQAQTAAGAGYPSKIIRLIVPWPAGGTTDIVGRVMAQKLSESLGQSVVVDNRPGASGSVGLEAMVRAPADGYTLLVSSMGTHTMNQFFNKLTYDPVEDVGPISMLVDVPAALVAHPSLPLRNLREVITAAKARPGHLNVASGSNAYQLFLELFKSTAAVRIEHVRYRGAGPAMNDLLGGQIEMLITGLPAITPHAKLGKLRMIAVTNSKRALAMPDVPTFNETLAGVELNNWTAMFTRAGTPRAVVERLNAETQRILALADVRERFLGLGAEPTPGSTQALAATLKQDAARWGKLIKTTGIQAD